MLPTHSTANAAASTATAFRKSSLCSDGSCVEVSMGNDILVRNSTAPQTAIAFSKEEWRVFVAAIRLGEFDVD
jgi:hypothetical protein